MSKVTVTSAQKRLPSSITENISKVGIKLVSSSLLCLSFIGNFINTYKAEGEY